MHCVMSTGFLNYLVDLKVSMDVDQRNRNSLSFS